MLICFSCRECAAKCQGKHQLRARTSCQLEQFTSYAYIPGHYFAPFIFVNGNHFHTAAECFPPPFLALSSPAQQQGHAEGMWRCTQQVCASIDTVATNKCSLQTSFQAENSRFSVCSNCVKLFNCFVITRALTS